MANIKMVNGDVSIQSPREFFKFSTTPLLKFINTFEQFGKCGFGNQNHQLIEIPKLDYMCTNIEKFDNIEKYKASPLKNVMLVIGLISVGLIIKKFIN